MKKNISINLFGAIYAIDEDAYELLKKYQENMRSYFSKKEGGEEIADDIEHRVGELMAELKAEGLEAVSIEHIEQIINRIGNPEQMNDPASEQEATSEAPCEQEAPKSRRLYRDPQDAMVGGVMSGLAHFFGFGDPTFLRLAMVALCIFSFSTILIIYIVLWIIVPQAVTAEERLRMKGRPINSTTLNEEIVSGVKQAKDFVQSKQTHNKARGCLNSLLQFIVGLCKIAALVGGFLVLICLVVSIAGLITIGSMSPLGAIDPYFNSFDELEMLKAIPSIKWQLVVGIFCLLVALLMPIFFLMRWLFKWKQKNSSPATRFGLISVWILSVCITIGLGTSIVAQIEHAMGLKVQEKLIHNGIMLSSDSWRHINNGGWTLDNFSGWDMNLSQYCTSVCDGNQQMYFYFRPDHRSICGSKVRLSRKASLPAGNYRLEGLAFANGSGSFVYAIPGDSSTILEMVPITEHKGVGNLSEIDWKQSRDISFFSSVKNEAKWDSISKAGRKWNLLLSESFKHPGGDIEYGLVCDPSFTKHPWNGTEPFFLDLVVTNADKESTK